MKIETITITTVELTEEEKKTLRDAQQIIAGILEAMDDHNGNEALLITDGIGWNNNEVCTVNDLLDNLTESYTIKID